MRCLAEVSALIKAASTMRMWLTDLICQVGLIRFSIYVPYSFADSKG